VIYYLETHFLSPDVTRKQGCIIMRKYCEGMMTVDQYKSTLLTPTIGGTGRGRPRMSFMEYASTDSYSELNRLTQDREARRRVAKKSLD
jgi:hypothetical protein